MHAPRLMATSRQAPVWIARTEQRPASLHHHLPGCCRPQHMVLCGVVCATRRRRKPGQRARPVFACLLLIPACCCVVLLCRQAEARAKAGAGAVKFLLVLRRQRRGQSGRRRVRTRSTQMRQRYPWACQRACASKSTGGRL